MKKLIAILLATVMVVALFAGCDNTGTSSGSKKPGGSNQKQGITLDVEFEKIGEPSKKAEANVGDGKHIQTLSVVENEMSLEIGKVGQIKTKIVPEDAADKSLYYESDDETIAKVDKDGKVLGVEAGIATISVISNDRNFKAKVKVTVYRAENDQKKIDEMIKLINDARKAANLSELPTKAELNAAATARAFEEAVEKDKKMDDTRPIKDSKGENKAHSTVLSDFDIYARGSTRIYVWDSYKDVQSAYDAIVKNEDNKNVLLCDDSQYSYIGAGCFTDGRTTYWCILLYLK